MKPTAIVVALSLAAVSLVFLAPPADAFGWCTGADVPDHQCQYHWACVGWSHSQSSETCQYGVGPWYCLNGDVDPCLPYLP